MPKLYHSVLQLPDGIEKNRRYLIEARTRALPGVESAFAGDNGSFSIYFRDPEVLKLLPALLGRESRSVSRRPSREPESDPEAEARICKINALISLGGFALLEAVKRSFPVLFGKISLIRSAFVILISKEIIRNGASGLIREHSPNADTLTATAVIASILAGKPESSLSLLVLSNFAEMLSLSAAEKARKHISHLLGLKEKFIWKIVNGTVAKVRIDDVKAGDQVAVYLGEKISVDGVVISGSASVDQSSLTGEFVPVYKVPGDTVFAGTVVQSGQLVIEAHRVGVDTNLSRIVHMVENAQNRRAPVQNFADRLASMLVPISFIAAGLVYVTTRDVQRVLNMFFIDYSCGLRLSTATAISAAISRSAQIGVLVKGEISSSIFLMWTPSFWTKPAPLPPDTRWSRESSPLRTPTRRSS